MATRARRQPPREDAQRPEQRDDLDQQLRTANQQLALATLQSRDAAERTERERERLAVILDTMPGGVWVTDASGEIILWNLGAEEIWGSPPVPGARVAQYQEAYSLFQLDGVTPYPGEESPLGRALLAGEMVIGDRMVVRRKDGSEVVVLANARPIRDESGVVTGAVAAFVDVTPLYRLEQRRAEELALVSHDLRSPLTAVSGQAQMIERAAVRLGEEKIARCARLVVEGARRMDRMIDDLVEASRVEGGALELRRHPVWLPRLVADLVEQQATTGEQVLLDAPEDFPILELDPSRIERVITNLLVNAIRFSPEGEAVHIRLWEEGGQVRLSVSDRGPGIGPEDLPHIFERRYRGQSYRGSQGLGLGLYICKGVVEAHGGRIWVESEVGEGAAFHLSLPLAP